MIDIYDGIEIIMRSWLKVKRDEIVHYITDETHFKELEVFINWANGNDIAFKTTVLPSKLIQNGDIIEKMVDSLTYDDVIIGATGHSFITTKAVTTAINNGARFLSLPLSCNDNTSLLEKDFISMNINQTKKDAKRILSKLNNAETIHVTTKLGTDLTLSIKDRIAGAFTGEIEKGNKGSASLEVYVAPIETTTNGVLYLDGSFGYIGTVKSPIKVEFKDGVLIKATSKDDGAKTLLDYIKRFNDETMFKPGEFGIGLNRKANCTGACYIEDESTYSTFHIGMGRNISLGGKQNAKGHFDIVTHKPTIYADDKLIMLDGQIQ